MKLSLHTGQAMTVAFAAVFASLLMPVTVVSTVTMAPAFAQESIDDDDDDGDSAAGAPVGGVAAGAGGTVTDGPGLAPATLAGGLVLAGAGAFAYRRRRRQV